VTAQHVLVVEDDAALRQSILEVLLQAGYAATGVSDGISASERLHEGWALVLLDIGLPFVDGWRILESLEASRQPSVVVISARGAEGDKVRALDLGADDYLTKPFGAQELLARVRAVIRRSSATSVVRNVVRCGDVIVDLGARSVSRAGVEVRLSPTEWVLLAELAQHPGEVMDHRTLLGRVWGPGYIGDRPYLRTFIQRLRRKLEADPSDPRIIETVGRHGYRFGPMQ